MASEKEFDLTREINEMLQFHMINLQREIAADNYRVAWRHAWMVMAALYFKATEQRVMERL